MGNFFQSVASSRPVVVNRFLDDQTDVAAFYSLRRLISTYSGPALTIRRDSDDQETDIYFDANDVVDVDAIYEFCGSGVNGYVKVWYDQGPNGLDLSQTDTTKQPMIWDGSSVASNEGKPAVGVYGSVSAPVLSNSNFTPNVQSGYSYFVACGPAGYNGPVMNFRDTVMSASTTGQPTHRHAYVNNNWQQINVNTNGYSNVGQRIASHSVIQSAYYDGSGGGEVYISRSDYYNFLGSATGLGSPSSQIYGTGIKINHQRAMSELMIFNADKSSIRKTIESNINDFYGFASLNYDLPLDTYTNVVAAWSVRKVRSAYTGYCMEVYNGTTYADIGFNEFNELDVPAIAAHCGANDGFVSKWYSQGTSTCTFVQTNPTLMPQIYDGTSGTVFFSNGKPQVQGGSVAGGDGNTYMETSAADSINGHPTAHNFIVMARSDRNSYSDLNAVFSWGRYANQNEGKYMTLGGNSGGAGVGTDLHIDGSPNQATKKNSFFAALGNNVPRIVSSIQNYNLAVYQSRTILGVTVGNIQHLQEILIFDDDMSDDREAIEQNQNSYFSVF